MGKWRRRGERVHARQGRLGKEEAVDEYLEATFGIDAFDHAPVRHRGAIFVVVDAQSHPDGLFTADPM